MGFFSDIFNPSTEHAEEASKFAANASRIAMDRALAKSNPAQQAGLEAFRQLLGGKYNIADLENEVEAARTELYSIGNAGRQDPAAWGEFQAAKRRFDNAESQLKQAQDAPPGGGLVEEIETAQNQLGGGNDAAYAWKLKQLGKSLAARGIMESGKGIQEEVGLAADEAVRTEQQRTALLGMRANLLSSLANQGTNVALNQGSQVLNTGQGLSANYQKRGDDITSIQLQQGAMNSALLNTAIGIGTMGATGGFSGLAGLGAGETVAGLNTTKQAFTEGGLAYTPKWMR